jgi:hypothetical protein
LKEEKNKKIHFLGAKSGLDGLPKRRKSAFEHLLLSKLIFEDQTVSTQSGAAADRDNAREILVHCRS